MKIKLTTEIKQADGIKSIANPDPEKKGIPWILKDVCISALLAPDQKETDKEKYSDYELFQKIRDVKEVDLKTNEIVRIKKKIGLIYPALVLGQAWDLLEGKEELNKK